MDLDTALQTLEQHLAEARPVPLSASVMVNKDDLERIAAAIKAALPEEIRNARWVLRERDEIVAQATREAEQIIGDGKVERARLVTETEVVKEARREAERIIARANAESRRIRHEADDYVDAKLGDFEVVLQKTLSTVTRGRDRLRGRQASAEIRDEAATNPTGMAPPEPAAPAEPTAEESDRGVAFFDHGDAL